MRISDWSSDVCSSDLSTVRDDVANGTFVETVHEVRVRRNKVRLPKRKKVSNFYLGVAPTTHRRYAGVLLIDKRGRFILQRRDAHAGTYTQGMLSMFGGRLAENEDTAVEIGRAHV